jgi:hypothetical protein
VKEIVKAVRYKKIPNPSEARIRGFVFSLIPTTLY